MIQHDITMEVEDDEDGFGLKPEVRKDKGHINLMQDRNTRSINIGVNGAMQSQQTQSKF